MTEQTLADRAYATAMRMHQQDNRITRPKPEDFVHLLEAPVSGNRLPPAAPAAPPTAPVPPAPSPAAPPTATSLDAAVRASLARMQSESRVSVTDPPDAAA